MRLFGGVVHFPGHLQLMLESVKEVFCLHISLQFILINLFVHYKLLVMDMLFTELGCIVHADDIFLMSHSSSSMKWMLDICFIEIAKLHLHFNTKKYVTLHIGIIV